jgi:hypothetical protein
MERNMISNNPGGLPRIQPQVGGADPTLSNPGFFELATFPGAPSIIPEAIAPFDLSKLPKISQKDQKNYLESIMRNFMQGSMELQASFALFLGGTPPKK